MSDGAPASSPPLGRLSGGRSHEEPQWQDAGLSAVRQPAPHYADPYLAGVALGLVLLASFAIAGRGLGASGAFTRVVDAVRGQPQADNWLVLEVAGVIAGGFVSALLAGRIRNEIERGPRISPALRLAFAFAGGAAMGVGAVLARGCTSGLALTGGALLSVGSWIFMLAAFVSAYALAPLLRRAWR